MCNIPITQFRKRIRPVLFLCMKENERSDREETQPCVTNEMNDHFFVLRWREDIPLFQCNARFEEPERERERERETGRG